MNLNSGTERDDDLAWNPSKAVICHQKSMPREPSGPLSTERARERRALHEGCRCGASLVYCCTSCCSYCSSSIRLTYPKAQTAEGPSRTQRLCPLRLLTLRMADLRRISTRWRTDLSRCARVSKCEACASPAPCMSCCCRPSRSLQLRLATTNLSHQPSFSCLLMHFPPIETYARCALRNVQSQHTTAQTRMPGENRGGHLHACLPFGDKQVMYPFMLINCMSLPA